MTQRPLGQLACLLRLWTLRVRQHLRAWRRYAATRLLAFHHANTVAASRPVKPSRIPPLCIHFTRAEIEWRRCHHVVCMAQPCEELHHSGWACA